MIQGNIAVIFDMDGVLVDSVGLNWSIYNQVLEQYGIYVPTDKFPLYIGRGLSEQLDMLSAEHGREIDQKSFIEESNWRKESLLQNIQAVPGIRSLIERLQASALPIAIGTSSDRAAALQKLEGSGLAGYFDEKYIVAQEDVVAHKPQPDVYLACAARLGVDPARCVVIEDAPTGIEAARAAGMKCIALRTPYIQEDQLQVADLVVSSPDEITVQKLLELLS